MNHLEHRVAALVDNGLSVPAARAVARGDLTALADLLRTMAHILDELNMGRGAPAEPMEGP